LAVWAAEAVLDGDVVRSTGRRLCGSCSRAEPARLRCFDLLWLDGEDLRALPLSERQRRLTTLLPADTGPLYKMFTLEEHGRALYQAACRMELEGIVAKRKQDPYGPGTVWYTIRNPGYVQDDGRIDPFRHRPRSRRTDREPAAP
jgi:ATP-dependent DNA ligase